MAKKKHKAKDAGDEAASAPAAAAPVKNDSASTAPIDVAYRAGNYAGVRNFAASAGSDAHAQELVSRVRVDPQQILIGAITLFVVALAAFLTLR